MTVAREQDTLEAALSGKLGQSGSAVQTLFRDIDRLMGELFGAVDRRATRRAGEWEGRSYVVDGRTLIRLDPKAEHVRVRVGTAAYERAPVELRGSYRQRDWLVIRPEDREVGLGYLREVLAREAGAAR